MEELKKKRALISVTLLWQPDLASRSTCRPPQASVKNWKKDEHKHDKHDDDDHILNVILPKKEI